MSTLTLSEMIATANELANAAKIANDRSKEASRMVFETVAVSLRSAVADVAGVKPSELPETLGIVSEGSPIAFVRRDLDSDTGFVFVGAVKTARKDGSKYFANPNLRLVSGLLPTRLASWLSKGSTVVGLKSDSAVLLADEGWMDRQTGLFVSADRSGNVSVSW